MSRYPNWTEADTEALREGWGQLKGGIPALARKLGRSVNALKIRAQRLGLGPWLDAGEWISVNQLIGIVTGVPNSGYSYTLYRWRRMGLPVSERRTLGSKWRMVRIEAFWPWAEAHRRELDFSRFEEGALGIEPGWAREKRKVDQANRALVYPHNTPWSPREDALLKFLCERGTDWAELDSRFRRTGGAIRRRIYDLGLPRPADMGRRGLGMERPWRPEELEALRRMTDAGHSIDAIARKLGRTSQSVRGKREAIGGDGGDKAL